MATSVTTRRVKGLPLTWDEVDDNFDYLNSKIVSVKDFGAVGDGVTDDTAAINAAFTSSAKAVQFPAGTYKISAAIVSAATSRDITGNGATLVAATSNQVMLDITGNNTTVRGLRINGNSLGRIGVQIVAAGCTVEGCEIFDLAATVNQTVGIAAETLAGVRIVNNTVRNLTATGNSTLGDGPGACRAIQLYGQGAATAGSVISGNIIDDIFGEEGDAIQTLFFTGTYPFFDGMCEISGNTINNFNRRGIKIQSSKTLVCGNVVTNDLSAAEMPNYSSCISLIASDGCNITNNIISAENKLVGIYVAGSVTNGTVKNNLIGNNTVRAPIDDVGLFADYAENCVWTNNVVVGGSNGMSIGNSTNCAIVSLITMDGTVGTDVNITATNTAIVVKNTVALNGTRGYVITNNAPNCIVEGTNSSRTDAGTGCIRTFVTATGSVYRNSSNASSSSTVIGDLTGQFVDGAQNLSTGGTGGVGGAFFASPDIPSTSFATKQFSRGDVAFLTQPSPSGFVGWVCTASGTPGVWKTFGLISA